MFIGLLCVVLLVVIAVNFSLKCNYAIKKLDVYAKRKDRLNDILKHNVVDCLMMDVNFFGQAK